MQDRRRTRGGPHFGDSAGTLGLQRGQDWLTTSKVLVAKQLDNPYEPNVRWLKIENPDYSQKAERGELFNPPRIG